MIFSIISNILTVRGLKRIVHHLLLDIYQDYRVRSTIPSYHNLMLMGMDVVQKVALVKLYIEGMNEKIVGRCGHHDCTAASPENKIQVPQKVV